MITLPNEPVRPAHSRLSCERQARALRFAESELFGGTGVDVIAWRIGQQEASVHVWRKLAPKSGSAHVQRLADAALRSFTTRQPL